ncbi:MAG: ArsR/SmtB family transcription factor [Promethearchaeota archaeon]
MTNDRFKNYIDFLDEEIAQDAYLKRSRTILKTIENEPQFIEQLKIHGALSNKKRFLILKFIEKQPICTCALAKILKATDGAISHHLKILERAGLIIGKKEGYFTSYYTRQSLLESFNE